MRIRLLLDSRCIDLLKLRNRQDLELGCIGMLLLQLLRGHLLIRLVLLFMFWWLLLYGISNCL